MGGVNVIQSEEIGSAFKLARLDELTRSQAKYSNVPNLPIPSHHLLYSFQGNTTSQQSSKQHFRQNIYCLLLRQHDKFKYNTLS